MEPIQQHQLMEQKPQLLMRQLTVQKPQLIQLQQMVLKRKVKKKIR
jgi:hypothetical protein